MTTRLRNYLEETIIPRLEMGRRPTTTVRRLLEMIDRKRRHPNDGSMLDGILAAFEIKVTPLVGECVDIDTTVRFSWLDEHETPRADQAEDRAQEEFADVYRVDIPGYGIYEIDKRTIGRINFERDVFKLERPVGGAFLGKMTVYTRIMVSFGLLITATEKTWRELEQGIIRPLVPPPRKKSWWPF